MTTRGLVREFVKAHDRDPSNNVPEPIPESRVNEDFADLYLANVIGSLGASSASDFHEANAEFFKYLPPPCRARVLTSIHRSCAMVNDSAFCRNERWNMSCLTEQAPADVDARALSREDIKTLHHFSVLQDPKAFPAISAQETSAVYKKIQWLITRSHAAGLEAFALRLEDLLKQGRIRLFENMEEQINASGFVDPRTETVYLSCYMFEASWADEAEVSSEDISETELLAYARKQLSIEWNFHCPELEMGQLEKIAKKFPRFRPKAIQRKLLNQRRKQLAERYAFYYGSLARHTFPPEMPSWLIGVAHEVRHVEQYAQNRTNWNPSWLKKTSGADQAYYFSLLTWVLNRAFEVPQQMIPGGMLYQSLREIGFDPSQSEFQMEQNSDSISYLVRASERDAALYGVHVAKKLLPFWRASQREAR